MEFSQTSTGINYDMHYLNESYFSIIYIIVILFSLYYYKKKIFGCGVETGNVMNMEEYYLIVLKVQKPAIMRFDNNKVYWETK